MPLFLVGTASAGLPGNVQVVGVRAWARSLIQSTSGSGAGLPAPFVAYLVALEQNIRDGHLDVVGDELAQLIGRPTTSAIQVLTRLAR